MAGFAIGENILLKRRIVAEGRGKLGLSFSQPQALTDFNGTHRNLTAVTMRTAEKCAAVFDPWSAQIIAAR